MDKAFEMFGLFDTAKMIARMGPFMKDMGEMNKMTIGEFSAQFKDPLLKEGFEQVFGLPGYPLLSLVVTMSLLHNRAGGYPIGGSFEFSKSIEKRYLDLGGKVFYGSQVKEIMVTEEEVRDVKGVQGEKAQSRVEGVRLEDGTEVKADFVISAADLKTTVYQMLKGKFIEPQHEEMFKKVPLAPSSVQVFFGLNHKFTQPVESASYVFRSEIPVLVGDESYTRITERNYNYDPGLSPDGKSVISSMFVVKNFEYWQELRKDKIAYQAEKDRIVETVTNVFEKRYPGFKGAIETTDVVTPMTYVRYTGVYKGTYMTWILASQNADKYRMVRKTLPGLSNFWLSGMWIMPPGGVPTGAKTSRDIIQLICKQEKIRFRVHS